MTFVSRRRYETTKNTNVDDRVDRRRAWTTDPDSVDSDPLRSAGLCIGLA